MLRVGLQTNKGPIAIIGINAENKKRLEAGMPLDVDIKDLQRPGMRITRVIFHYAHTYEDVVRDMEQGGLDIPDELLQQAKDLDKQVRES